jgi:hypothetical protein
MSAELKRNCETCAHLKKTTLEEPCYSCGRGAESYSNWQPQPTAPKKPDVLPELVPVSVFDYDSDLGILAAHINELKRRVALLEAKQ